MTRLAGRLALERIVMKKVVLTGVSRGLGKSMVAELVDNGCQVIGCARSAEAIESLRSTFGGPHQFDSVDVACDESVRSWADGIIGEGPPDILINNAAVINRNAVLWEISAEEFDRLTAVNINGTANMIRHFVPSMIDRGSGLIVNFSSGWGRSVSAKVAPYRASKWAIEGLTQALAEELPSGMAAVPLNPGVINTDMLQSCFGGGADGYPRPDEWARRAVPFILQLDGSDNGQSLSVL